MALGNYTVWLTDDKGNQLEQIDYFTSLSASRVANQIANFTMTLPLSFDRDLIKSDQIDV